MKKSPMDWKKLLSSKRLGKKEKAAPIASRSPFQVDFDRLIFSSSFRRLQDKTQVFPLAESDYVRTRLTHSLEVSSIGRSLGTIIGYDICKRHRLNGIHPSDFGAIIAAAALAHDIGNPPFGHSGEDAIRHWFDSSPIAEQAKDGLTDAQKRDIEIYDGNAQGFRLITRLQMSDNPGGMQLTLATLAAFMKYPFDSGVDSEKVGGSKNKFGFFQSEKEYFKEIAETVGLIPSPDFEYQWCRHPLALIVEAADDISYRIIDYEDGYRLGLVSFEDITEKYSNIIADKKKTDKLGKIKSNKNKVEYLRAKVFEKLIAEITECFLRHEGDILRGNVTGSMIDMIGSAEALNAIKKISKKTVYSERRVIEIEAAGFEVAGGLLDIFVKSMHDVAEKGKGASSHSKKYIELLPEQFRDVELNSAGAGQEYARLLNILDFYSGMTDSYAVSLFKKIRGISLPDR